MKNLKPTAQKGQFLTVDFYIQRFFCGLALIASVLYFYQAALIIFGYFFLIPIAFYNLISLIYHFFKGSYSKEVESFRKIYALSAVIYLVFFFIFFFILDGSFAESNLLFGIFLVMPPLFFIAYFFITWKDWKAMKKLDN